ncbi:MAG: hypothetical protein M3296_03975 [Actinomycetota bacterium]|nr:hypothetical protein [Actinomycetota bacterium]
MSAKTAWGVFGYGLAVVGVFLPYAVESMPSEISISLVIVGALMIVVPTVLWAVGLWRDPKQSEKPAGSAPSPPAEYSQSRRVGILNVGPGSRSETYGSEFGTSLQRGIENRAGGGSRDWGSKFGDDAPEDCDAQG